MNELHNGCCIEYMKTLADGSVDHVITDPPYLYLDHKLDRQFDLQEWVNQVVRVLNPKHGYVVMFGRGRAFYEINTMLAKAGLHFTEEIIWHKGSMSGPGLAIGRVHETISIHKKGKRPLNKIRLKAYEYLIQAGEEHKYIDYVKHAINGFVRILQADMNDKMKYINDIVLYLKGEQYRPHKTKHELVVKMKQVVTVDAAQMKSLIQGISARSIFQWMGLPDVKEKQTEVDASSVMYVRREHYSFQHPTQKPVELMQYLIKLVSKENEIVLDPFMGGGSTGVACRNLNRQFIGCEIDEEYFNIAVNRIVKEGCHKPSLFGEE